MQCYKLKHEKREYTADNHVVEFFFEEELNHRRYLINNYN